MGLPEFLAEYGTYNAEWPRSAGRYDGKLIVCADGWTVWDDLEALGCVRSRGRGSVWHPDADFMVVNKLGETFPGEIAHWYSNEPHMLARFVGARRAEYGKEFANGWLTHSCNPGPADCKWPWSGHGTSGLNAILTGLGLGYREIVVCGMPLDNGPHNGEPPWRGCNFTREVADTAKGGVPKHWQRAIDEAFEGRVTSMSGRTRAWLGAPS